MRLRCPPSRASSAARRSHLDNANPDNSNPGITLTPAHEELNLWMGDIVGAISQVGASRLTTYMS